jgi:ribulose-bisphosphate carboxylase large chain
MQKFEADYLIETPIKLEKAAAVMAGEQSTGTFIKVPGETVSLHERSGAQIEDISVLMSEAKPSLPGSIKGTVYHRAKVTLSWPLENIGADLINLAATIAGNLFELQEFSGLRILDIRLPAEFLSAYSGPKFGIAGTRKLSGVEAGAIIGTIIKPSIGLNAEETAQLVSTLCDAGIDFIKDDELQADGAVCPFDSRVKAVMKVIRNHYEKTGKKVMYAFNLSGDVDQMRRRHDIVQDEGGTCVMASLNAVGLSGFLSLSRHTELPIHAHRNGWGALSRSPALGWSYPAWSKLWRLAGADHMHVNGLDNKFSESDESVMIAAQSILTPLASDYPFTSMPVFSSGQTARQVQRTYGGIKCSDCIYAAGGGVLAHPKGPKAGVIALRQAWDAALSGVDANDYAATHPELADALKLFSK